MKKKPTLVVITGPTASGKSALAVSLAERLQTEIISADSRQIYKGIPIVTAVPSAEERKNVKHHLLEILGLEEYYSAARFAEDAETILNDLFKRHDTAIVCGGSMMYVDALTKGIDELPTVSEEVRDTLMEEWNKKGDEWLRRELEKLDPDYYARVDLQNLKRVFHAVEVSVMASQPYSSLLTGNAQKKELGFDLVKICLTGDRQRLFERINERVIRMVETGLEDEARAVYAQRHLNSLNTVGLKEMFAYFDGKMEFNEAIARIQKNTRVYAKKQLTWHKRDESLNYLDFSDSGEKNLEKILHLL